MLNKEKVHYIAHLARLTLSEQEIEKMQESLTKILDYVAVLNRLENSTPESSLLESSHTDLMLRPDEVVAQKEQVIEQMLAQCPQSQSRYIKVRAILS